MKVQAIRTDKGNFLAKYNNYFFYVGSDRKTLLRMSEESEWEHARQTWGQVTDIRHITKITEIIELSAISEKIGRYINSMKKACLSELVEIQNFKENFCYVNNDFNYVVGFYCNGKYQEFSPICGGAGTSEYGNHGTPTSWDGESYIETLRRFIIETSSYPEIMVVENSNHDDRQGNGWKSETDAFILPKKEAIDAFLKGVKDAYEALKNIPILIQ